MVIMKITGFDGLTHPHRPQLLDRDLGLGRFFFSKPLGKQQLGHEELVTTLWAYRNIPWLTQPQ